MPGESKGSVTTVRPLSSLSTWGERDRAESADTGEATRVAASSAAGASDFGMATGPPRTADPIRILGPTDLGFAGWKMLRSAGLLDAGREARVAHRRSGDRRRGRPDRRIGEVEEIHQRIGVG